MKIIFSDHAKIKFKILKQHGFVINKEQVKAIVDKPDTRTKGKKDRFIFQGQIDETHVMRVILEIENNTIKVITFYPARRERYENQL